MEFESSSLKSDIELERSADYSAAPPSNPQAAPVQMGIRTTTIGAGWPNPLLQSNLDAQFPGAVSNDPRRASQGVSPAPAAAITGCRNSRCPDRPDDRLDSATKARS